MVKKKKEKKKATNTFSLTFFDISPLLAKINSCNQLPLIWINLPDSSYFNALSLKAQE